MGKNSLEYLKKIDNEKIVALIPARGGSKGIPGKNIQMVKGYPLIAYSIAAGTLSAYIGRVIVSTDSEEIAEIARYFGAEVPFLRPAEYASDNSGDLDFVKHAIQYFYEEEGVIPEYLVHLRPTTPLREVQIIDKAILECMTWKDASSLRSAHKAAESPYKWFLKGNDGIFRSINENIDNDAANGARQKFPDVYIPDGYVDVLKSSYVVQNNRLHGEKMIGFESPNCIEIDVPEDLDYARYKIEKQGLELFDYLKENFKEGIEL